MQQPTYSGRKFGPAASTISLANHGGGFLGGIWVSAKGTSPTIVVYDASASVAASLLVPSFVPTGVGLVDFKGIGLGNGLCVKVASCSGTILWQPAS